MAPSLASSNMVRWIVILSICSAKLIGLAEAGMKGKGGRQGHIIIQNEIKDQNQRIVPIYMPIPIPVPMPMGHGHGSDSTQHHQHHHRHHQQRQGHSGGGSGDDEGEVKKIYLLQPMPKIQPQLKGGQQQHIMGPVQTHIHLPVPMAPAQPVNHHRRPQNFNNGGHQQQHHKQNQYGDGEDLVRQQPHKSQLSVPGHSDMKILPIVVIPPIAPMPPVQLQSNPGQYQHQPYESRLHHSTNSAQPTPNVARRHHHADNYGGSGGGAMFREAYSGGGGRGRRHQQHKHRARGQRFQDQDMGNDDYGDYGPPRPRAAASQQQMRAARAPLKRRRHSHHHEGRRSGGGRESIRDIINDQQQQVAFDDELDDYNGAGEQSATAGCCGSTSPEVGHRQSQRPTRPSMDHSVQPMDSFGSGNDLLEQQQQPPESYARAGARASRLTSQDKAELAEYVNNNHYQQGSEMASKDPTYYEHDVLQTDRINQRELTGRRLYSSEREALDDDEWWFDSIKSVSHVASPTIPPSPTSQTSANETTANGNPTSNANATTTVVPQASQERTKGLQL